MPGVVLANPMIEGQVMAAANNAAAGVMVRGVRQADLMQESAIAKGIREGNLRDFEGDDAVAIGHRLARKLGLRLGDQITLVSPQNNTTPFGSVPRLVRYRVAAIFDVGMFEYDSAFVYVPFEAAQTYFRLPNAASAVEVRLENPDQARQAARQIMQRLGQTGVGKVAIDPKTGRLAFNGQPLDPKGEDALATACRDYLAKHQPPRR